MDVGTIGEFEQALSEADGRIRLTADLSLSKQYGISSDTEIDLNGHAITANRASALFAVSGSGAKLTLKGGSVSNRSQVATAADGGEIVIEDGEYNSSAAAVIRALPYGSVTVNGGELTGREGAIDCRENGGKGGCYAVIVVNDGHLTGIDNYAIATNGSDGMGHNSITVNGGLLEGNIKTAGYEAIGVYIANSDTFTMNGGEIIAHGGTGICMRAGCVNINGGTITATNVDKDGNIVTDGQIGDDPTVMTGCSAIIFHETSNYPGQQGMEMELYVNGGVITGIDHSIQVLSNAAEPKVYVTGGTLSPAYP